MWGHEIEIEGGLERLLEPGEEEQKSLSNDSQSLPQPPAFLFSFSRLLRRLFLGLASISTSVARGT